MRIALMILSATLIFGCHERKKYTAQEAKFELGKILVFHTVKNNELTLINRYELDKPHLSPSLSNYFQYELGNKIKLVIGKDTIKPGVSYYVPLLSEKQREIDCKYMLDDAALNKPKT